MRFYPTKIPLNFLYFAITTIFILISCNKDSDLFRTTINPDTATSIEEEDSDDTSTKEEEKEDETVEETVEEIEDEVTEDILEDRTTSFPAINDAHFQSGKGFNQNIIRLEEGNRTSYLMFDLGAIESIEGQITDVTLQFTISGDDGSGNIKVFKGVSNDWTEEDLVTTSVPNLGSELGSITKEYTIGTTEEISLDITEIAAETNTLILNHQDGNDLAFASKEHASKSGPKLVVGYKASIESEEIIPLVTEDEPEETAENSEAQNQGPMAVADGTPTEGEAPHEVTFTGSGSSDDKKINSYSWDFKDGEKSTEADPKHSFTEIGTYEVLLTVKDEEGLANTDTVVITVTDIVNTAPVALMSATPKSGEAPLLVAFKGSNSTDDIGIRSYAWDFKDGDTATNADPKHTFTEVGTYEVVLKVTDEKDLSNSKDIIITVTEPKNEAPVAVLSANKTSGNAPLSVQFNGDKSTDDSGIATYEWDFQDAASSTDENPSYTFTKTGSYAVELTVTDEEGLISTKRITIAVSEAENEGPVAVASANKTSGEAPLSVQFTGDKSTDDKAITKYEWDFQDAASSNDENPTYTFNKTGSYPVRLTVTDAEGQSSKKTVNITVEAVQNQEPSAIGSSNLSSGQAPLTINFRGDQSTDDNGITSYAWDFNDGSTSIEANPSHTFENPGTYKIEFTVTDADGASDTDIDTITVQEGNNGGNANYPSYAVFASSFGFKAGDATEAFEAAIESGSSFLVFDKQSTDWIIRPKRLFDIHDITIVFEAGVVLRAKSGAFNDNNSNLFQLIRPKNVTIEGYGATFKMNKSEYGSSEFRHALAIRKGENIIIRGLTLMDSGGDGIFLGGSGSGTYSKNITIEDVVSKNNSRQGMSIISAENVWVRNSEFLSTSGVKPETGVDLEPDYANERLVSINFINCKFSGNDSHGFMLSTGKLNSSSRSISVVIQDSEFSSNSKSPQNGVTKAEVLIGQGDTNNPVKGEIRFERVIFDGSNNSAIFSRKSAEAFKAVFRDCVAKNVSKNGQSPPIEFQAHELENTLGGFDFGSFRVKYNSTTSFMQINAPSQNGSFRVKDIIGNFTIEEPNNKPLEYFGGYDPSKNVNVSIKYQHN